jgi:DeoR/GlpR family transcriptional regulator of sugar metabolism
VGGVFIFIEERHQKILEWLEENGRISATEIQSMYEVSFDTARRDLRILGDKGFLRRTYGGALSLKQNNNIKKEEAEPRDLELDAFKAIAMKAASIVQEQDVIFIAAATIGHVLAENLPKNFFITVVTNSIVIAEYLRKLKNVRVIVTGGEMDETGKCLDILTIEAIRRMRFDKCFITSTSISAEFGLSIKSSDYVEFTNAIINSSKKSFGLYTTEKIGYESIISICPANKLDVLITNWNAPHDELKKFDEQGIEVILADHPMNK